MTVTARSFLLKCVYSYLHNPDGGFGGLETDGHVVARAKWLVGVVIERKGFAWGCSLRDYLFAARSDAGQYQTCSGIMTGLGRFHDCRGRHRLEKKIDRMSG